MISALCAEIEVIPIVFIVIFIGLSVISTVVNKKKLDKKRASQEKEVTTDVAKKQAEKKMSSVENEHDEIIKKRMERQAGSKNTKNVYASRHASIEVEKQEVKSQIQLKEELKKKHSGKIDNKQAKIQETHSHPAEKTNVTIERKPTSVGSLGTVNDEGCAEHGDMRFVLDEVHTADTEADEAMAELQRMVVWGEVLNKPKSKQH